MATSVRYGQLTIIKFPATPHSSDLAALQRFDHVLICQPLHFYVLSCFCHKKHELFWMDPVSPLKSDEMLLQCIEAPAQPSLPMLIHKCARPPLPLASVIAHAVQAHF